MKINTITIVGANGTMGANVAAIFASFGHCKVNLVCRNIDDSNNAIKKAVNSVKCDSIMKRLKPYDYTSLESCLNESDAVFESVTENLDIKELIMKQISEYIDEKTLIFTGTSGLSINQLADFLHENQRKNFYGVHMFNPPYNLSLCELITTNYNDKEEINILEKYLSSKLLRTVIRVDDKPGFLANRIGFQFINKAFQLADEYKHQGGINYIDSIMGLFTGRNMSPLNTANYVGLDVHKAIVVNIYINTNDYNKESFIVPNFVENLIKNNNLGRKTGYGIYHISKEDNVKKIEYYDICNDNYKVKEKFNFKFRDNAIKYLSDGNYKDAINVIINSDEIEAKICLDLILNYIVYSLYLSDEISNSIYSGDDAMATGFNWCPPLAFVDLISEVTDFVDLVHSRISKEYLADLDLNYILSLIKPSKYDYRKFIKAKP